MTEVRLILDSPSIGEKTEGAVRKEGEIENGRYRERNKESNKLRDKALLTHIWLSSFISVPEYGLVQCTVVLSLGRIAA